MTNQLLVSVEHFFLDCIVHFCCRNYVNFPTVGSLKLVRFKDSVDLFPAVSSPATGCHM